VKTVNEIEGVPVPLLSQDAAGPYCGGPFAYTLTQVHQNYRGRRSGPVSLQRAAASGVEGPEGATGGSCGKLLGRRRRARWWPWGGV